MYTYNYIIELLQSIVGRSVGNKEIVILIKIYTSTGIKRPEMGKENRECT